MKRKRYLVTPLTLSANIKAVLLYRLLQHTENTAASQRHGPLYHYYH